MDQPSLPLLFKFQMNLRAIKHVDILDEPSDAIIYSTNVLLNCTGGVGAALMGKYGGIFQKELHHLLAASGRRYANQGEVFQHVSIGMPYKAVFHAVPCDGWYDTNDEIVRAVVASCLTSCVARGDVSKVVLSALATGYGHMEFDDFIRLGAQILISPSFDSLGEIVICVSDLSRFEEAADLITRENLSLKIVR